MSEKIRQPSQDGRSKVGALTRTFKSLISLSPRRDNVLPHVSSPTLQVGNITHEALEVELWHGSLDELVKQLSPSDQRLVRELAFKLAGRPTADTIARGMQPKDLTGYVQAWASRLTLEAKSPGTVKVYVNLVMMLLRAHPNPTSDDIEAFLLDLGKRCRPGVVANMVFALNSFFSHLIRKKVISSSPLGDIKAPPVPLRVREIPTTAQIAKLLKAPGVTLKDRAIILVFIACGLRNAELTKARRRDVDLEHHRITVIGKGNKQRVVPMSKQAVAALEEYLLYAPKSEWLFPGRDSSKPCTLESIDKRFKDLSARAGIQRVVPHQLRHYLASFLLSHGVGLKDVSLILGHANPSVTANVYWHLMDEAARIKAYEEHDPLKAINEEVVRQATSQLGFDLNQ